MFTQQDLNEIAARGIDLQIIESQINNFKKGFPHVQLLRPATPGDGILRLAGEQLKSLAGIYETEKAKQQVVKFVPASGAASRMFQHLYSFLDWFSGSPEDVHRFTVDQALEPVRAFVENIREFAFFSELELALAKKGQALDDLLNTRQYHHIIASLLNEDGLNYGNLPKGLLRFHVYPEGSRTPIEEHLAEGMAYCRDSTGCARLHFTLSPEHADRFLQHAELAAKAFEQQHEVHFSISASVQKPSTDTIAVDMNNQPFRDATGNLVFRPGGHGALIENLNDLDAPIIFIKNIDNVVPDHYKQATIDYKEALAGLLLSLQAQQHAYLRELETAVSDERLLTICHWIEQQLNIPLPKQWSIAAKAERQQLLHDLLYRPMRVCGMVKNAGEPGGGPFWVSKQASGTSLQIVESSQVNLSDASQKEIFMQATHFNPVDLVCGVYDHEGKKFDLREYVDPTTGFIAIKSKDGRQLKAQELPGLWNGAMADWITLFVEVPIETFNPVKTINDLLREMHR